MASQPIRSHPTRTSSAQQANLTTVNATPPPDTPALSHAAISPVEHDALSFAHSPRSSSSGRHSSSTPPLIWGTASYSAMRHSMPGVWRWNGLSRTSSEWNFLRRDEELWDRDGDCYVFLYAHQQSLRGASFCVDFQTLKETNCGNLFNLCFAQYNEANTKRLSGTFTTHAPSSNAVELFIPAPENISREEAFRWHLSTRNYFAWAFGKPLVGTCMGQALVDLQDRMDLFRSDQIDNHEDLLSWAEAQGYRDIVDWPQASLAWLYFGEHYKLRHVWIDAFAHCVGMYESLSLCDEFDSISRLTKALITRAYLQLDSHLGRVKKALGTFLNDDMAYLGLPDLARAHVDRFRAFLHTFYSYKFGVWPPPTEGSCFARSLYMSMFYDFQKLYQYLVDSDSTADLSRQKPASGGICVLQNVEAFNSIHKFHPLPHPLPLLPTCEPSKKKTQSQKALRSFTLGSKQGTELYISGYSSLTAATNFHDTSITGAPIVQAYMQFERQNALGYRKEKVAMAEARKVRWLLIYGMLQYLSSAIRAPKEVRDTESPEYPLCCIFSEKTPTSTISSLFASSANVPDAINNYLMESGYENPDELIHGATTSLSIQPDCQTDAYFAHTNPDAALDQDLMPPPLRINTPSRTTSFRRFSFSSRGSRRNSITLKSPPSEVTVRGHDNEFSDSILDPHQAIPRCQSIVHTLTNRSSNSTLPEGAGPNTSWLRAHTPDSFSQSRPASQNTETVRDLMSQARTPIFNSAQMERLTSLVGNEEHPTPPGSADSTSSPNSPIWSDGSNASSRSSTNGEAAELEPRAAAEESGLLGGLVPIDIKTEPISCPGKSSKIASPMSPIRRDEFRFSFNDPSAILKSMQSSLSTDDDDDDTNIGVALSAPPELELPPPPPPPKLIPISMDSLDQAQLIQRSLSTESFMMKHSMIISPLRMHPPGQDDLLPERRVMDLYALEASSYGDHDGYCPRRTGSETPRPYSNPKPLPIPKTPQPTKANPQAKSCKIFDEEERGRKKERRKSFWRR